MESPLTISTIEFGRFRYLTLASPELWKTSRLSHRSRSWKWAALFVERSRSRLLDISINLEAYTITNKARRYGYDSPIRIQKALSVVGPQIHRWRTLALDELVSYMFRSAFPATSRLESVHVSVIDEYHNSDASYSLAEALAGPFLRSLRITLDSGSPIVSSPLKTLVIRDFFASHSYPFTESFDAMQHHHSRYPLHRLDLPDHSGWNTTSKLATPPIQTGIQPPQPRASRAHTRIRRIHRGIPQHHPRASRLEPALFPTLRTLRLVDLRFSPKNLALIQSFSQGITTLELSYTSANKHLLTPLRNDGDGLRFRRSLWRDTALHVARSIPHGTKQWFATRALNAHHLPSPSHIVRPIASASKIHLRILPSPSLTDSPHHHPSFYYDDDYLDIQDFEHTEVPVEPPTTTMAPPT
ncbi:hypothetical protein R3P38DRAFT_3147009 [Favolaschia claudopus]|uniref:Uncharacterized protein n=1 Tax=Favolaschia claudopus TaxID=2862362 RepID=A0AAV9Z2R2_9AGAR